MKLTSDICDIINIAEARAVASAGPCGLNVVPVSMARATADEIWLFNFFMGKTIKNIEANEEVALSAWSGLAGVQVKGTAVHETSGERFEAAVAWVREHNPSRTTKGVVVITPTAAFDISADPARAGWVLQ